MRLVAAIDPPDEIKKQLQGLYTDMPGALWSEWEQLHLTLRFIGEVDSGNLDLLHGTLASVKSSSFPLMLSGISAYPPGHPRDIRVGIEENDHLQLLYENLEIAAIAAGITMDNRQFSPHITIARFKEPPLQGIAASFLDQNRDFECNPFVVDSFNLYSSTLTGRGSIHKLEETFKLSDGFSLDSLFEMI